MISQSWKTDMDGMRAVMSQVLSQSLRGYYTRRLAERAIQNRNNYLRAVLDFVRQNFPYVPDPVVLANGYESIERLVNPELVAYNFFEKGYAVGEDCDSISLLSAAMLSSVGVPSRIVIADTGSGDYDHAYAQGFSDSLGWLTVDPTTPFPVGWEYQTNKRVFVDAV